MTVIIGSGTAADVAAVRQASFGGPLRTAAPVCEVRCTTPYNTVANSDALAETGWTASPDADAMATIATAANGYSRIVIPQLIPGRYKIDLWARSTATTGSAACKVLLNGTSVTGQPIASDLKAAGGEGTPLHAEEERYLAGGDILRWATWASAATTWASTPGSANFTTILHKILVRYVGPN